MQIYTTSITTICAKLFFCTKHNMRRPVAEFGKMLLHNLLVGSSAQKRLAICLQNTRQVKKKDHDRIVTIIQRITQLKLVSIM